ncbi:unnamed protein product [Lampetra planeri]
MLAVSTNTARSKHNLQLPFLPARDVTGAPPCKMRHHHHAPAHEKLDLDSMPHLCSNAVRFAHTHLASCRCGGGGGGGSDGCRWARDRLRLLDGADMDGCASESDRIDFACTSKHVPRCTSLICSLAPCVRGAATCAMT